MNDETEKISADIPRDLHKTLTDHCEKEGRKIRWYVQRGLEMVLEDAARKDNG